MSKTVPYHLFGIRHHGPGCARSLVEALEGLQPDCLLVEGPPEGEALLDLAADPAMVPPVALLVYAPEDPARAVFYPFAEFSPEWQALRYGLGKSIPVRFFDLPQAVQLALRDEETEDGGEAPEETTLAETAAPRDPIGWLGQAAGYGDGESWWNHQVEERGDGEGLFPAIAEAMLALREDSPPQPASEARREALREAQMRQNLRAAVKEGFQRIAVVCGAWHVPALAELPPAKADQALLKGLAKIKVAATWVPWTNGSLARAGGYGAGVDAPGWYEHLWRHPEPRRRLVGWLAKAAQLFRQEDLDCSSAHLIETVRLAESLAALRERPAPGLPELMEALQGVVCMGDATPLELIAPRLLVGERLGSVPAAAPTVPLQKDLEQQQRSLRLKPEALSKVLDLDLRQPNDLARSHLLHRLRLLGIPWGEPARAQGGKGSFHEVWQLQWQPEFAVAIVNASRWGSRVETAATAKAVAEAKEADLPLLAALMDRILLASLAEAVAPVAQALEARAAVTGDVPQLLAALPPLAGIQRYGDVRGTDSALVGHLLATLIGRAASGLPAACSAMDEAAASGMRPVLLAAHRAVHLVALEEPLEQWRQALRSLARPGASHGLLVGLAVRLLFDDGRLDTEEVSRAMGLALSIGSDPAQAAGWLEGFLHQGGMVLLHDDRLWQVVDRWLTELESEAFHRTLPLVRRAFADFGPGERQQLGERARHGGGPRISGNGAGEENWDAERAVRPLPLLKKILGLSTPGNGEIQGG